MMFLKLVEKYADEGVVRDMSTDLQHGLIASGLHVTTRHADRPEVIEMN
jgi:hypothetical protein